MERLYDIDNFRIYMIIGVVLHHVAVIYGVPGGWYYAEYSGGNASQIFLTILTFIVRAFVLGFFFFIAAFFTPASYDRKGPVKFMKERLIKLGIPLVVYSCIIGPSITYLVQFDTLSTQYSFLENICQFKNVAPAALWFVEVLLIFSFLYVLWRLIMGPSPPVRESGGAFPSNAIIMAAAIVLGLATFLTRIYFPATYIIFHLRPGNYPPYIALFILGTMAYRRRWLSGIDRYVFRFWVKVLVSSFSIFLLVIVYDGVLRNHTGLYRGGMTPQGLFGAMWENIFCMAVMICALYLGHKYNNFQGRLLKAMSANAFAVYVFHAPVVVAFTCFIMHVPVHPLVKFAVVSLTAVPFTFLMCNYFIRKLPLADPVLK
jgi:glucans biosynthesis protein C